MSVYYIECTIKLCILGLLQTWLGTLTHILVGGCYSTAHMSERVSAVGGAVILGLIQAYGGTPEIIPFCPYPIMWQNGQNISFMGRKPTGLLGAYWKYKNKNKI